MTAKRGSMWKSGWNRARGTPDVTSPGQMAFFNNFNDGAGNVALYRSAGNVALGTSLPFWFGAVGVGDGGIFSTTLISGWLASVFGETSPPSITYTVRVNATISSGVPMDVPAVLFVEAVLVVVTELDGGHRIRIFSQNQVLVVIDVVAAYTPPGATTLILSPSGQFGSIHGGAGGNFDLTPEEMSQWFIDLRNNLSIQAIPGKTTHLYSAGAAFPAVPNPLPNLGGGQTLPLVTISGAPAPLNTKANVKFNW